MKSYKFDCKIMKMLHLEKCRGECPYFNECPYEKYAESQDLLLEAVDDIIDKACKLKEKEK